MAQNNLLIGYSNNKIPKNCKLVASFNITNINYKEFLFNISDVEKYNIKYFIYYTRTSTKKVIDLENKKKNNFFKTYYVSKLSSNLEYSRDIGNETYVNLFYDTIENKFIVILINSKKHFMKSNMVREHPQLNELLKHMWKDELDITYIYNNASYRHISNINKLMYIFLDIKERYIKNLELKSNDFFKPILINPILKLKK